MPSSQFGPPISLFLDLPLPFEPGLIVADLLDRRSLSRQSAFSPITLSPIYLISLISDFFFGSGVGGGVLVVSVLCGGGFCDIKFVWKLRKWLRKCEKFVGK